MAGEWRETIYGDFAADFLIVFSRVGSVDRRAIVRRAEDGWMFSGRCLRVRPNTRKIDPGYLSYFFGLPSFKEHIRAIAVGATMPSLNTSILSDVVVPHPPNIAEQQAIAHILGTLDDKIELNRRMNETLSFKKESPSSMSSAGLNASMARYRAAGEILETGKGRLQSLLNVVRNVVFPQRFSGETMVSIGKTLQRLKVYVRIVQTAAVTALPFGRMEKR